MPYNNLEFRDFLYDKEKYLRLRLWPPIPLNIEKIKAIRYTLLKNAKKSIKHWTNAINMDQMLLDDMMFRDDDDVNPFEKYYIEGGDGKPLTGESEIVRLQAEELKRCLELKKLCIAYCNNLCCDDYHESE